MRRRKTDEGVEVQRDEVFASFQKGTKVVCDGDRGDGVGICGIQSSAAVVVKTSG